MLGFTVPREERMEEAFEWKMEKYKGLFSDCHRQDWRARCLPVEVGAEALQESLSVKLTLLLPSQARGEEGPSTTAQRQQ